MPNCSLWFDPIQPTIYHTRGEQANHYAADDVRINDRGNRKRQYIIYNPETTLRTRHRRTINSNNNNNNKTTQKTQKMINTKQKLGCTQPLVKGKQFMVLMLLIAKSGRKFVSTREKYKIYVKGKRTIDI